MKYETVIGLEVHAQLKTQTKLFSGSQTQYGAAANTQTSFIDAALPGTLPVLNTKVINMAVQFGLAIGATINDLNYFERKNYFYPDLPKGYQISQFQRPIVSHGLLEIKLASGLTKAITIERAHLEEDAGKSLHEAHHTLTGIDLNRAGTPLLEIVTTPCMHSAEEVIAYLKTLHQLLRFLDICDGNMQEGSFRCDVNISLRAQGCTQLGVRSELKNINSFRFIEQAIHYEQARHQDLLKRNMPILQETRLYNPTSNRTEHLRSKENENDYRYFPDPDLLPVHISKAYLEEIQAQMPPLPSIIRKRLRNEHALSEDDIEFLLTTPEHLAYFEATLSETKAELNTVLNWMKGPVSAALNQANASFASPNVNAKLLASLLDKLESGAINGNIAKKIFAQLLDGEQDIDGIMAREGYNASLSEDTLESIIKTIISQYPTQVADYKAGKDKLLGFFIGEVMKSCKGQADPADTQRLLKMYLS